MDKNYDVIVVGGGLAGLSATYKLTKDNKRVLLLEKDSILGGRTPSILILLIALPGNDDNNTLLSALPIVVPNPLSNGSNSNLP